jgi:hypothetical protein
MGNCRNARANTQLAYCDANLNNRLTGDECCQDSLGGPDEAVRSLLPDRDRAARAPRCASARCPSPPATACVSARYAERRRPDQVRQRDSVGVLSTRDGEFIASREGQYAVKFVARLGGVVYDPSLKGLDWRPADTGVVGRSEIEACAEANAERLIASANRHDGWRANDVGAENQEDFDRGLCSGQTYTVVFSEPGGSDPWVRDKVGNTLGGQVGLHVRDLPVPRRPRQRVPHRQPAHRCVRRLLDPVLEQVRSEPGESRQAPVLADRPGRGQPAAARRLQRDAPGRRWPRSAPPQDEIDAVEIRACSRASPSTCPGSFSRTSR